MFYLSESKICDLYSKSASKQLFSSGIILLHLKRPHFESLVWDILALLWRRKIRW